MADQPDKSQKTEEPTAKRLEDARKKGDIAKSQDVPVWFMMVGGAALLMVSGPIGGMISQPLIGLMDHPHAFSLQNGGAMALTRALAFAMVPVAAIIFGVVTLFAFIGHFIQARPLWTAEKMKPKLSKLSPIGGLGRMFGPQGWMNLLKSVLKLAAITLALAYAVWPEVSLIEKAGAMETGVLVQSVKEIARRLVIAALVVTGMIAAIDFLFQKYQHHEKMKMTRQEVKDEHKQSDGDPQVKAKIRQLRQERSRKRMMAEVPKATVIIANPTHYSVALRYDETTAAPVCIAKGVDDVALRIRIVGEEAGVPIVENPPLARALFALVDLDDTIPREHFEAVAKIIGFVMRTKTRR